MKDVVTRRETSHDTVEALEAYFTPVGLGWDFKG